MMFQSVKLVESEGESGWGSAVFKGRFRNCHLSLCDERDSQLQEEHSREKANNKNPKKMVLGFQVFFQVSFPYLSPPILSKEALVIVLEISTNKIEQNHKNNNKHWIFYQSEICHSCADDLGKTVTFMTSLALLALKFYDSIWLKESESEVTQLCPTL